MITCTLSDKQLSILRTKIAKDLLTYIDTSTPFNLKEYLLKMYNAVKDATDNENSAIDYARLTVPFIKQLLGVDTTYDAIRDLGLNIVELYDLTKDISVEDKGINNLIEYLDLNTNPVKQLKNVKDELQKEENQQGSEKKNIIRVSNTIYGVTGKPATAISTTIQELIDGNVDLGKDPRMAVYTAVTKKILAATQASNAVNEGMDITGKVVPVPFEGVEGGLVLTFMPHNRLAPSDTHPNVQEALASGVDKNYLITQYNNGFIFVVTDVNGNPVKFNDDAEVDSEGKLIYFRSRYLPKRLDDNSFDVDNVTNVRTPVELSQNLGISVEDARERLQAEFEQLERSENYVKAAPGNTVIYNITGGSYGSQNTKDIDPVPFTPTMFKSGTPVFAYLKANQAGDNSYAGIYVQDPISKIYYITESPKLQSKVEELVQFLTEDVVHPDGDLVSGKEKVVVLSTYVLNSIKDIHYKVDPETDNIEISIAGKKLNLSTNSGKEELRNVLLKVSGKYDRKYVVSIPKANKNETVSIFSMSGNTAEISKVPYQKYLETFLRVVVNLDSEGNTVTYNPYLTLSLANQSSSKILIAPENIEEKPKETTTTSKPEQATEGIYPQLGDKTQSPNLVISNIKTKDGKYDRAANIKEAQDNGRVYSMETDSDLSFSNPWAHFKRGDTIKTATTKEAVQNYIDWLTTDKFKDVKPERREWILNQLKSGSLKGKAIQYYAELNEPSHATALDYLINKYDWSKGIAKEVETIQPGLDLYKNALTKEEQKEFFEFGKSVLEQHGYNPFPQYVMASAGQMEWSPEEVVGKDGKAYTRGDNYNKKITSHKKKVKGSDGKGRWAYHYYLSNLDGSNIIPIPSNIISILERITGQDMSDYDTVLINLYPIGRTLGWHVDVSEDTNNLDRDIISVSIGADSDFYYSNTPDDFISGDPEKAGYKIEEPLSLKSGDVLSFGGESRLISHTVKNVKGTTDLGSIDLSNSNVNEDFKGGLKLDNWRINFTFRVADPDNNKGKRGINQSATEDKVKIQNVNETVEKAEKATFTRRRTSSADSNILDQLKNDDFIDKFKNKLKNQGNVAATKEQIRLAKIWYENSPLSKHVPFKVMFNMINTATPRGVARWDVNGITLFKGSDYSDLYHEAWHAFTQMFLTKADKEKLYAEARKQSGEFRTFEGQVKKFSEATEEELEEYLAEDFREFMLGKGKKVLEKTPVKKNIFQRIFDFLMSLFGKATTNDIVYNGNNNPYIKELYEKLAVGDIVEYTFDQKNRVFTTLNKTIEAVPGITDDTNKLSYEDSKLIGQSINSIFSKGIDLLNGNNTNVFTIAAIRTLSGRSTLYKYTLQTFKDMLNNALLDRDDMIAGGFDTQEIDYEIQLLTFAVKHFGNPDDLTNPTGVIKYHMETSKFFELEDREVTVQRESLDNVDDSNVYLKNQFEAKSGNESSAKALASSNLLYTIKSLYSYDSNGDLRTNRLGIPLEADYNAAWNRLFNITDGAVDVIDIYNRLSEAAKDYPMVKQFLNKVGHPSSMERVSQDLWTDITHVFTMPRIPLVVLRMEHDVREVITKEAIINEETNEIIEDQEIGYAEFLTIRPSRAGGEYNNVGKKWDSFFTSAEEGKYIYTNSDNINVLNVDAVLEEFSKYPNNNTKEGIAKIFSFMEAIGMPLENTKSTRRAMGSSRNPIFKAIYDTYLVLKAIQTYNKVHAGSNPIIITKPSEIFMDRGIRTDDKNLNNKFSGYRSRFETIQKFQLTWSDDFSDTTVSNATGATQYEKSLKSTLSNEVTKINNSSSLEDLTQEGIENPTDLSMNHLAKSRNPFAKNLMILNRLFDENGKKRIYISSFKDVYESKLELLNASGSSVALSRIGELINESGIESANADETTKYLQDFFMLLLYGSSEATRHADKATTYMIRLLSYNENGKRLKHFFDMSSFATKSDPMGPSLGKINFVNNAMKYLSSEYERMQKLLDGDEAGLALVGDSTYKEIGSKFVIFDKIIGDAELKELEKFREASIKTAEDFTKYLNSDKNTNLKNRIEGQISNYLDTLKKDMRATLGKMNFFNNKNLLNTALSTVVSRAVVERSTEAKIEEYTDALLEGYVANDWTNKFEITTLFYGDVATFKSLDDFFKRNAGVGSTGSIPRTDKYMIDYINDRLNKFSYAKTVKLPTKSFGKTMTTAVLADKVSKSVYLKEYIQTAKAEAKKFIDSLNLTKAEKKARLDKSYANIEDKFNKAYGEMTEADGQGWISFDAYRALLMSLRKWSPDQEKLFVKISNNEKVDINEVLMFFPVKKFQYWGPLLTKGLPIRAFHKFSLMPLIPNIIGDKNLGILHQKMMEQKIDYTLMLSGSKLNTLTTNGKVDKFYNDAESAEDRSVAFESSDYTFTPNEIFLENFKDQVEVHDHYDGRITFSTQLRKLIENGLMANGVPTDWRTDIKDDEERYNLWEGSDDSEKLKSKNYNKILRYEALLFKLVEIKKEQLSKKIGTDKKALVKFVKDNLSERELSDNELDFIDYNGITNDFKNDLDLSLSASQIEKLLIGIVQKKLINQKVTGEALVQVSGVGFESSTPKLRKATKKESKLYGGTNSLSTYHMENGKVRVSKVKISLQGNFKKLLYLDSVIQTAKEKGIDRLDALNSLIRDEAWLDKAADPNKEIYTKAFARLNSSKGDAKLFILKSELTPELLEQLTPNTKDGKRVKGKEYHGIKILGDYYSHNTIKSKDGDNLDIIVVDKVEDAEAQYQAYIDGGAKNFTGLSEVVKPDTNRDFIRMVAVRIPVQGLNSMEVMEVFEFLPESSGNIVILPAEIVAKSGGDFDIDKMFTLMPNISAKLFSKSDAVIKELSNQLGYTITKEQVEELEDKYNDFDNETPFTESEKQILNLLDILMEQTEDKITVKLNGNENTVKGVENALLKEMASILTMPENFINLVTPNGIDILSDLATDMAQKVRGASKEKQPMSKIFEIGQNMYKHQSNSIGKAVLGIIAVANTFNTLFARTGLVMSGQRILTYNSEGNPVYMNQDLYLNHNTINGNISLSSMYDKDLGNKIADVINQMINGAVDVAKDAWIFDIQGNKEVIPSLLFMIQAGVPIKDAVHFVSQPIIRDYINKVKLFKSQFAVPLGQPDTGMFFRLEARNSMLFDPNNGFTKDPSSYINPLTGRYDKTLVFDLLGEFAPNVKSFSSEDLYKNLQRKEGQEYTDVDRAVFAHFLQIQEMSGQITQLTQALKFDNDRTVTLSDARIKLDKIAELSNGISDESIQRIVKDSPIAAFKIQDFIIEKFGGIFKLKDGQAINNMLDRIFERQADNTSIFSRYKKLTKMDEEEFRLKYRENLLTYLFQSQFYKFDINTKSYQNQNVEFTVEELNSLLAGVGVKDGVIYVNKKDIKQSFDNKDYLKKWTYGAPLSANILSMYDNATALEMYTKFLYERETLRTFPENSLENIEKSSEYAFYYKKFDKEESEKVRSYKAYESVLRDKALTNIGSHGHLFYGPMAYGRQIMNLSEKYPDLFKKYQLLDNLSAVTIKSGLDTFTNLKFSNTLLTKDDYNQYVINFTELANPSVKKVEDDADNQKISELFQILPLFAILQSGSDAKSTYSLIRAIPFESYLPLISKPYNDFVKSSLDEQSSVLADYTLQFVKSQYNKSNKFKNKLKNWANSSVKNLELTQDTRNRIINLDPSIVPPDPFSSQEEIGDDADSSRVVKLNGPDGKVISINLNTLNIGFTPNAEQLIALQQMVDFIEANPKDLDQKMFSLKGYAGTGKTSITKILLKYLLLRNIRTGLTATTHKAKSVLARATETQTSTLHKLLGLRPSPKPLEELDLSELNFLRTGEKGGAANVIIIDESSFISDSLYSFIEDEVNSRADLKIIFIGDPAQIKPVKQKHTSKVFTDISNSYELTTVERQTGDNPLGPILDAIRSNIKSPTRQFSTDSVINGNEGIGFVDSEEAFLSAAAKAFRSDNFATNRNFARIVTYSNDKVTDYNKNIRKSLGLTGEFREGEVLMSYQNAQYLSGDYLFKNSVDYVIIASEFVPSTEIGKRYLEDAMFTDKKLNTPVTVAGYRLLIQDLFDSSASPISIFVLDPNTSQESLDRLAEQADALDQQAKKTGVYKNFNGFTNSFLSTKAVEKNDKTKIKKGVDYGYAHTIHKSQGATYTNIFVDLTSLSQMTDIEQKNQLTYVGLSRATNIAYARVNKGDAASLPTDIEWNDSFTKVFSAAVGPVTYKYPLNISTYNKIKIMEDPSTGIRTFSYNLDIEKSKYMVDGKLVTKAITVPMKGILTEATVKEFIADYPNALVMFNDYDGNGNPIGSNSIWRLLGNNAAGVTTKHGPAPTKIGSDKHNKLSAMTDATLDDNKRIIDASLNAIENQLAAPGEKKFLVIDEYGFGQYMIGYVENQPTVQKPTLPVIAKQTFLYLSEQLYRKFGYINPHYLSFKEGRMLVQKGNAITDEDIIEQRKCNFKSK